MRIRNIATLLLFAVQSAMAQQALVVDDNHLQMERPGKPVAAIYKVAPGASLILDATKYEFRVPKQLEGKPINSVQVVVAKDRVYSATWDSKVKTAVLSESTLRASQGSLPFVGFEAGQKLILAIGSLEGKSFNVLWVGLGEVE